MPFALTLSGLYSIVTAWSPTPLSMIIGEQYTDRPHVAIDRSIGGDHCAKVPPEWPPEANAVMHSPL